MKQLLLSAAVMVVLLSACSKEPAPAPAQPAPQATPAPAVAVPGTVLSNEEKMKIVQEAKKKANKGD